MPQISRLRLPRKQKITLVAVFALGGLVIVTSILGLKCLYDSIETDDESYDNLGGAYWAAAEINVAIVCASLPYLRPLISHFFPNLLSTNSPDKYNSIGDSSGYPPFPPTIGHASSRKVLDPEAILYTQDQDIGLTTMDREYHLGKDQRPRTTTTNASAKGGMASGDSGYRGDGIQVTTEIVLEASSTPASHSSTRPSASAGSDAGADAGASPSATVASDVDCGARCAPGVSQERLVIPSR